MEYGAGALCVGVYAAVVFGAVERDVAPYGAVEYGAGALRVGAYAVVVFGAVIYCGVVRRTVLYVAALGGTMLLESTLPLAVPSIAVPIRATPAPGMASPAAVGSVEAVVVGSLKEIVPAG